MAIYDTEDDTSGFIVDGVLGHHIWQKVNASPRVNFGDGIAILARLEMYGKTDNLVRIAGEEADDADDWGSPFSLMNPKQRLGTSFAYKVGQGPRQMKEIRMGVYAYGTNGALFTQEYYQDKGDSARAMIRVPVPDRLSDEVDALAQERPNCEIIRTQVGAFNERFAVGDEQKRPPNYVVPHMKCEGVTDRDELMAMFDDALQMVERGVRMST